MTSDAIEITDLCRTFPVGSGRRTVKYALDNVNLCVARGSVHGLLGPNGAGKSTLSKILATVLLPTSGTAKVMGADVVTETDRARGGLALVLGGDRGLYQRLTARQNLEFWATLHGMGSPRRARKAIDEVVELVGLSSVDQTVERFSRGMKQRVHLARALLVQPGVLILDEPTMGMDPAAAHAFRQIVVDVSGSGTTVLLTTHDMREAEAVCDRVSLINDGRVAFTDTPAELRRRSDGEQRIEVFETPPDGESRCDELREMPRVLSVETRREGGFLVTVDGRDAVNGVLAALVGMGVHGFSVAHPTLEDVYLRAVGGRGMHVG
ncbi:ABC transporter ATP-binding protein [Nocardiopsis sp. NRRL B-16309]|uniref:ABC transporter ATP-binding protein n=1 Tax=Nocardiopsis sp. NRRL B-16309 TaxID=1519494 RepID=UPI0006AF6D94|nr:ABC transporter ATP-binding protein [Nocardiopsis sp. NRRL B-16309]KOX14239.1 hypothetical protein ADL05_16710 [Nocardiopsis sp. NRRL B-16309]